MRTFQRSDKRPILRRQFPRLRSQIDCAELKRSVVEGVLEVQALKELAVGEASDKPTSLLSADRQVRLGLPRTSSSSVPRLRVLAGGKASSNQINKIAIKVGA